MAFMVYTALFTGFVRAMPEASSLKKALRATDFDREAHLGLAVEAKM